MSEPTVRISGIVLASFMFQHFNNDSDVEGLVLGESRFDEQVTISDSQSENIHIEEVYNVQKYITCHRLNSLYSCSGKVNMEVLQEMLADNKQDSVIGWYRQRRNTEQNMTYREKLVHEQLKSALSNPHMIFMLLTPSRVTPTGSTYKMEYSAFIFRSRCFVNVPVMVNNLGLLEQQAYWKVSAPCSAAGYSFTMEKHRSNFFSPNGQLKEVNEVGNMNESLQAELQKACSDVEESERQVEALQTEVSSLRKRLREKQQNTAEKDGGKMQGYLLASCFQACPHTAFHLRTETEDSTQPRNNLLLLEAVRTLLGSAPLYLTQTFNLQAFPIPEQDVSMATQEQPQETVPVRERKRKRSSC